MNRAQIRTLVLEATGRSDKTSLINTAIDLALTTISTERTWSDLLTEGQATLLAGEPSVELNSESARPIEIRVIDGLSSYPLEIRSKGWVVSNFPYPYDMSPRRPCYGYVMGTTLFVVPFADINYEIWYSYYRVHPSLVEETDQTLIRGIDEAVAAFATYWVFRSLEKHEDSERWYQSYLLAIRSAKKLDASRSVVRLQADPRGRTPTNIGEYWRDPFIKEMP